MKQILYSVARTEAGELIRAVDAEKGGTYLCGFCRDPLILRKSGKTGPRTKRPHFAHRALSPNCSPESALHFEFKNMLADEIRRRIESNSDLSISWECSYCYGEHTGNLVKKARRVALEYWLGECRPDIALLDENDRILAAIEVVVTHPPEDAVKDHYRTSGITLVELRLDSEDVLNDVPAKVGKADYVQLCPDRKRCPKCGHFQQRVEMRILEAPCYKCHARMKVPYINGDDSRGSYIGPEDFTRRERGLAAEHGAVIEWQYSQTINSSYWAATCGRCKRFIGRHHLFTGYIINENDSDTVSTKISLGNFCGHCEMIKSQELEIENWEQ